jgi:hypothetical protein
MKYAMLIHYKPGYYEALSEDEQKAVVAVGQIRGPNGLAELIKASFGQVRCRGRVG